MNLTGEYIREYHPVANIFPLLQEEDFEKLKSDIEQNGQLEPIWLHPDGRIIDGRNRHRACLDIGIAPHFKTWDGNGSLVSFVVSLNLHRRHLTSSQKAAVALEILPMLEDEARERMTLGINQYSPVEIIPPPSDQGKARDRAAEIVGTNGRYVQMAKNVNAESPDLLQRVKAGEMSILQAAREIKKEKAAARIEQRREVAAAAVAEMPPLKNGRYTLIVSSVDDLVLDGPIDAIVTDPPYPEEYLYCYSDLSKFAAENLPDGGICAVMVGQSHLQEVMQRLSEHLTYVWTMAYFTPGQSAQIFGRRIKSNWKPVLFFVKGTNRWEHIGDTFQSSGNDKRFHEWGQDVNGMVEIIERLTVENQVVCDPFCGAGTTGVAALLTDRLFVGSDIDENEIAKAGGRLHDTSSA